MDINQLCPHCLCEIKDKAQKKFCDFCGKPLDQFSEVTHQLKPLTILAGKYIIGDVLGEGGFGITYIGFDLNLEMRVAIKEFYPNGFVTREAMNTTAVTAYAGANMQAVQKWQDSFIKEARSLAKCSHLSGVVGVKDFFQENNTAYIILEYLEGTDLKNYVKSQGGKVNIDWLMTGLEPVIQSLGEVHRQGIVHRDISPDNIRLMPDGRMKLMDFGAARDYTESGEKSLSVMLKHGYAPEEQYRSKGVQGPWTDIYALAGTIYKCITGITPPEAAERIRNDELQKPSTLGVSIRPKAEQALMKALAVYAEQRYQNIDEFYRDIYAGIERVSMTVAGNATVGVTTGATVGASTATTSTTSYRPPETAPKQQSNGVNLKILIPVLAGAGALVVVLIVVGLLALRGRLTRTITESAQDMTAEAEYEEEAAPAAEEYSEPAQEEAAAPVEETQEEAAFVPIPQRSWDYAVPPDETPNVFIYDGTVENYENALNPAAYALNDAHMQEQGIYFDYYFPSDLFYSMTYEYHNAPWEEKDEGWGLYNFLYCHAQELTGGECDNFNLHTAIKAEIGYYGSKGTTMDCTLWEYEEDEKMSVSNYLSDLTTLYGQCLDNVNIIRTPGTDGVVCLEGTRDGYTHRILIAFEDWAKPKSVMRLWFTYPTECANEEEAIQKAYVAECVYRMCAFSDYRNHWDANNFMPYEEFRAQFM